MTLRQLTTTGHSISLYRHSFYGVRGGPYNLKNAPEKKKWAVLVMQDSRTIREVICFFVFAL